MTIRVYYTVLLFLVLFFIFIILSNTTLLYFYTNSNIKEGYTDTTSSVPKVIYISHKNLDDIQQSKDVWSKLNPEYEIKLYDNEMCEAFLLEEYGLLHRDIFRFIPDGPIKCDFWRVCIINKYGGLYVDADIEPLVPLHDYIDDQDDFVSCVSMHFTGDGNQWALNPHIIYSYKNQPILQDCIDTYVEYYKIKREYDYWDWSICKIMKFPELTKKKSQIINVNGKTCKFLLEIDENNCEYNGVVVLHNRFENYKNHQFVNA